MTGTVETAWPAPRGSRGKHTPADARTLARAGSVLHYWIGGRERSPVVVFIHGVTLDHSTFAAQTSALCDAGCQVIAWDLRGHGASQPMGDDFSVEAVAEDVCALLDEIGAGNVILVGQSFGGAVAQEVCRRRGELVAGLVLIGTPALGDRPPWHQRLFTELRPFLLRLWPEDHLRRVLPVALSSRRKVQDYIAEATRPLSKADFVTVTRAAVAALLRCRPLEELNIPVLAAYGDGEAGWLTDMIRAWARREARVEAARIGDAGHLANQDNPDAFNPVLLGFVHRFKADSEDMQPTPP